MLVDVVTGLLIGSSVLLVVAVLALHRTRRGTARDRTTAASVATATTPVATGPRPGGRRSGPPGPGAGADDPPVGIGMRALDAWDGVALALVVGLMLAVPVVGGVLAAFLVPVLVFGPLVVLRLLTDRAGPGGRRTG